jgi:type I restriction enzyme, S subunit
MKDSGVEWIGEIPEHWDIVRMRFLMDINPPKSRCAIHDYSSEISFIPMELVGENGELETTNKKLIKDVYDGYTFFKDGDVIFAKITPCFENGKGAVARNLFNATGFGTTELHVLRSNEDLLNEDYLYFVTHSYIFRKIGESTMYGAGGQKRVPELFVKDFPLPLPPLNEQLKNVKKIQHEVDRMSNIENKISESISLLKEYRSSLITHAVTGQIDINKFEV